MPVFDSSKENLWRIPDDIQGIEKPAHQLASSEILALKSKNDTKILETGLFSDCSVICRDQTWKAHKVILNRCPYFARAFSPSGGFKEALESKITIENFEPFEVSWLLEYIYGLQINVEHSKSTSRSGSFLETCALLWDIGDFFKLPDLSQSALTQLQNRCRVLFIRSRYVSIMLKEIDFLPDLEAGIRGAWRHDRVASPMRQDLIGLCVAIHPFVKDHESFISLLDEIPAFTAQYVKALLGCPGMQRFECHLGIYGAKCTLSDCQQRLFDSKGVQVSDEVLVWAPTSLNFWDNYPFWFCSKACYNNAVDRWVQACGDP
ncbi:hypothetical protein F5883DRAFT_641586 [Diaporthe sp. PMI_573]|nr:hypothetical protein F5883DRAFT_641586 [Diaporthaceae sp. PMI_573]